jgi:hypothetical protein
MEKVLKYGYHENRNIINNFYLQTLIRWEDIIRMVLKEIVINTWN